MVCFRSTEMCLFAQRSMVKRSKLRGRAIPESGREREGGREGRNDGWVKIARILG